MRQQRERNWLRISYALSKIHWPLTPTALLQPLGYAGSLDLYLSRRRCNSRFRCTQPFNTTLPSILNNGNLSNGAQNSLHLAIMSRTERTWVVRIYAHKIGAYLQRLRLDCAGAQAEMSFCWPHMPNKTRFLMTIYDLVLQCQGKEDWFFSYLQMNVGLLIRLFNISGFPTFQSGVPRLYSRCAAHLFIDLLSACYMLQLHVPCYRTKFQCFLFLLLLFIRVWKVIYAYSTWKTSCRHLSVLSIRSYFVLKRRP